MKENQKIVIAGGTGFLGKNLIQFFKEKSFEIVVLSRGETRQKNDVKYVQWDALNQGDWGSYINDSVAVINLAGKSINCKHNKKNKKLILDSRVNATRAIGDAIKNCSNPPSVWINASGISIYENSYDKLYTETDQSFAKDFVAEVVKEWEKAIFDFKLDRTRQIALRIGVVLGHDGALEVLRKQTKIGLGGAHGNGRQIMPWIHIEDITGVIDFTIANDGLSGAINTIAPNPVSDKNFMNALRKSMGVRIGLPAPSFAIKIGSALMGMESSLILNSKSAYPQKLMDHGYNFKFEEILPALKSLK